MYSPKTIANYFLKRAKDEGRSLTQMQLQKLVYISHGWYLGITEDPLIDEQVEAWKFGPVVPTLYYEFREFGSQPITREAFIPDTENPLTPQFEHFLGSVWKRYGNFTGLELSALTHQKGSPWEQVVAAQNGVVPRGTDIPQDMIKAHYKMLLKKLTANTSHGGESSA